MMRVMTLPSVSRKSVKRFVDPPENIALMPGPKRSVLLNW
jgi:hypothetical protein